MAKLSYFGNTGSIEARLMNKNLMANHFTVAMTRSGDMAITAVVLSYIYVWESH
jgi:hypothetical protein